MKFRWDCAESITEYRPPVAEMASMSAGGSRNAA
jgi:hypothetical protein